MAGDTLVTVCGNIVGDPELRFTQSGAGVANFTIASTPRKFNKQTNAWEDSESLFLRCSVWRQQAESVTESLVQGTRVIVIGKLIQRSYEDREGQKRTVLELEVEEIGPSLKFATAKINRVTREHGAPVRDATTAADDPWSTPAVNEEAPF